MQTRVLRNLVKVSRVGSFLLSAEQLNMTLSALSMQMKALEAELDVALFDRSVRPPRLTAIGRSVVEKATDILEREDALLEFCASNDVLVGKFRIGFVTSAAACLLPCFLENVRSHLVRAEFEFETGLSAMLQEKVRTGSLDAAVVTDAGVSLQGLTHVVLREESFSFVAHSSISDKGLSHLIENHTFFHFMPQTGIGKLIASEMEKIDRPVNAVTVMLDNIEAIMGCVKNGLGYTLLPDPDIKRYYASHLVRMASPQVIRRSLILITRTDTRLAQRLDLLSDQF